MPGSIDEQLDGKIWRLLQTLFSKYNEQVKDADNQDDIDSESDYEDDVAYKVLSEKYP